MPVRRSRSIRVALPLAAAALLIGLALGCQLRRGPARPVPLPPGVMPNDLIDRDDPIDSLNPLDAAELARAAEQIRVSRRPAHPPEKQYNVLVLSGGAVYGAYTVGVLAGWTAHGDRPAFDVVTGVSTGALIAPLAFLGAEADADLIREYTTITNRDLFVRRTSLRRLFSESIVDNTPFRERLAKVITPERIRRVAEEHRKGRRLYVGTTNLDTKRLVVWDLGAIAVRNEPGIEQLVLDILIASASIPGFFPSVRFDVDIDGRAFEELHVDGGVSRSMFFRPPFVPAAKREAFGSQSLYGSNLYAIVAGKVYPDPEGVRARTFAVAGASLSNLLYANTRGDLTRLFNYAVLTGMDFHYAAIPADVPATTQSTDFDPAEMTKLFQEGYRQAAAGKAWAKTLPELEAGEDLRARTGLRLGVQKDPDGPPQTREDHRGHVGPLDPRAGIPAVPRKMDR